MAKPRRKCDDTEVLRMRESGMTYREIAGVVGVSRGLVGYIVRGRPAPKGPRKRGDTSPRPRGPRGGIWRHPQYARWKAMNARCHDEQATGFDRYGGRGIHVCSEWRAGDSPEDSHASFSRFLQYVESLPRQRGQVQLDRIDNDRGYEPGNLRWASVKRNARNKSSNNVVTINGDEMTVAEAAEKAGLPYHTFWARIRSGWDHDKAFSTPVRETTQNRRSHRYQYQGEMRSLKSISNEIGVPYPTLVYRMNSGWSIERATSTPVNPVKSKAGKS